MTKYVLLKSHVPTTFDGGFRAAGYTTIALIETPEDLGVEASALERILEAARKKMASEAAAKRKRE